MSEFGIAIFIKRNDEKEIDKEEQKKLFSLVVEASKKLKIKDEEKKNASPVFYDYDGYEEKSVSFVIYTSEEWGYLPEDLQEDLSEMSEKKVLKIGKEMELKTPGVYTYQSYFVEI